MNEKNINDIAQIICGSIDSPILVCQPNLILNCNDLFSNALGYESVEKLKSLDINYLFNKHFISSGQSNSPSKKLTIDKLLWVKYRSSLGDRIASVKVKKATWNNITYYTILFHDDLLLENKQDIKNSPVLAGKQLSSNHSTFSSENVFDPTKYDLSQLSREEIFERFYRMIYSIPCSLFMVNADGTHCYVNEYHQMIFGSDTYESWSECIHPQDVELHLQRWKHSLKTGEPLYNSKVRIRKHPSIISEDQPNPYTLYVININPFWDKSGKTVLNWLGVCTDIQELKDAQESSELKSKFLSMMSHEFRTPLFGIIGSTSLLMDSSLDQEQLENVKNINRSAELLLVVIQDILDFSKIESETLSLNPEQFNLNNLIKDTYHMFQGLAKSKNIDLHFTYPDKSYELIGDSARLLQILVNLTSNSIKFTKLGYVNISCNLTTNYHFAKVCFLIEDTGIGIPPEAIPDLFRPWSQASNAKTEYIGSGLGLCICRSLIDLMQGNINIESEVNQGTKIWFTVDLPLAGPDESNQLDYTSFPDGKFDSTPTSAIESPAQKLSKVNPLYRSNNLSDKFQCQKVREFETNLRRKEPISPEISNDPNNVQSIESPLSNSPHTHFILIAEDNPVNQIIIKKYIKKISTVGFVLVSDGKLAWDEYQKHPRGYFDLILLDHLMPEMGGDQVCKLIKEKDPNQIVISVSANALPTDVEYFKQIGMDDFLEKPFTFPRFKTLLEKWLQDNK